MPKIKKKAAVRELSLLFSKMILDLYSRLLLCLGSALRGNSVKICNRKISTNLVVILQHLRDDSDLGVVVFDGYHPDRKELTQFVKTIENH